jgi:hypothetical protein
VFVRYDRRQSTVKSEFDRHCYQIVVQFVIVRRHYGEFFIFFIHFSIFGLGKKFQHGLVPGKKFQHGLVPRGSYGQFFTFENTHR